MLDFSIIRAPVISLAFIAALAAACTSDEKAPEPPKGPIDSDLAINTNGGGCYPSGETERGLGQVVLVNPEWAPVIKGKVVDSDPILVHGSVAWSHGDTGGDFPANHLRSDFNAAIILDPEDEFRLGTGNIFHEDMPSLELEWETGAYPSWAWPDEGDRVVAMGRWIFDCGHPNLHRRTCTETKDQDCSSPDDCRAPACPSCVAGETCDRQHYGYSTELHPPQAVAAIKQNRGAVLSDAPGAAAVPVTRAEVFISDNGGGAGDRCVVSHIDPDSDLIFATNCFPKSAPLAQLNKQDFAFELPLPARPSAGAKARWKELAHPLAEGVRPASIEVSADENAASPHLNVRVKMTEAKDGMMPSGYGATILAGWDAPPAVALTHIRVHVDAVKILDVKRPAMPVVRDVKTWHMQVGVNGEWQELPHLEGVEEGSVFPQTLVFDQFLPPDGTLHIVANGTSQACIDTLFGKAITTMIAELGTSDTIDCLLTTAQDPGEVDVKHEGPMFDAGAGMAHLESSTPAYTLSYTVERVD